MWIGLACTCGVGLACTCVVGVACTCGVFSQGTIDEWGHMQITDRSKDVIKSGGEWISSIEIENLAVGHPQVAHPMPWRHRRHSTDCPTTTGGRGGGDRRARPQVD